MTDGGNLTRLLETIKPDEIYNMAAMSHVHASFDVPEATANVNALGPLRLLDAMRNVDSINDMRFYQASSSEMFGSSPAPQNEQTPFEPCSPYGVAKLYAYWMVRTYRDAYGLFASNGILFNHESPTRGEEFVTQKIAKAVREIKLGQREKLFLGNLDSQRDWGHAKDYMEGIWKILQHDKADDFVLATGQSHTVREFVTLAFAVADITIEWQGEGMAETGRDKATGKVLVEIDETLFRPKEVNHLLGDASKAKEELGWSASTTFQNLVQDMVNVDGFMSQTRKPHAA